MGSSRSGIHVPCLPLGPEVQSPAQAEAHRTHAREITPVAAVGSRGTKQLVCNTALQTSHTNAASVITESTVGAILGVIQGSVC